MTKPKVRNKKYNPRPEGITYQEKVFLYTPEDSLIYTIQLYQCMRRFQKNVAVLADRTTMMIRLHAAMSVVGKFEHNGADRTLETAIDILKGSRDKVTRQLRPLMGDELIEVNAAIVLADDLFSQCTPWEEVKASKEGENRMIVGADKYDYCFIKVNEPELLAA